MQQPKKWHEVYPYGTKAGNEEALVFRALSRHAKYDWRSTGAIVKATGLTRERVEEIIDKYVNKINPPLIYAHKTNEDHWGYWERCPEVLQKDDRSTSKKDKDNRVDKQLAGNDMVVNGHVIDISDGLVADAICNRWKTPAEIEAEDIAYFRASLFKPMQFPHESQCSLEQTASETKTRKLKAVWSYEAQQDLRSQYNLDAEAELTAILAQESQ